MDYLKNHCWCSSSHWDNKNYDCQIIVSLKSYNDAYVDDWENLTEQVEVFSQERFNEQVDFAELLMTRSLHLYGEDYLEKVKNDDRTGCVKIRTFKPYVLEWLDKNIPDINGQKAWCVGSSDYVVNDSCSSLSVFMQRRKDAMLFIKTFSKWKKPVYYCQYFTDVRKELDLETLKYKVIG